MGNVRKRIPHKRPHTYVWGILEKGYHICKYVVRTQCEECDMKYKGRFGDYGGFYVPEVLIPVLEELEEAFYRFYKDQ